MEPPQILSNIRIKAKSFNTDEKKVGYHLSKGSVCRMFLELSVLKKTIIKIMYIMPDFQTYLNRSVSSFSSSVSVS